MEQVRLMDKYIITKRKKYPRWMSAAFCAACLAYLGMDICRLVRAIRHTKTTEVEE